MAEVSRVRADMSGPRPPSSVSAASEAASSSGAGEDVSTSAVARRIRQDKTGDAARRFFAIPDGEMPLAVFVNPKSGGKQGARLLDQFRRILDDRQVFDMMEQDPMTGKAYGAARGLKLYGKLPNLSVLVCGGDGSVGWVLATIEGLGLSDSGIRVGTIPLGTGNDLARALKFGAGYSGQTALKLLAPLVDCASVRMDRWAIDCTVTDASLRKKNYNVDMSLEPPQRNWNNYFSIGSDAHTALQFHLRREKNPKRFNSQWRNKMTYGIVGGFETLNTKFRKLSQELELVCDGVDYTAQIREKKIVALAFLNIHCYGAGTQPWGTKKALDNKGFTPPRMDDGKLEVLGFWPWSFPKGQAGVGHAWRICQCSEADVNLLSPNPMQIDGEPCYLAASRIRIRRCNQATMLCHRQGRYRSLQPILSSGATTPDTAAVERCPVYEVVVNPETLSASQLRRLGDIQGSPTEEMDTMPLSRIRTLVDTAMASFATTLRPDEYNFLKFERGEAEGEGKYIMVNVMSESATLCRGFLFPVNGVRPGVFIAKRVAVDEEADVDDTSADTLLQAVAAGDWRQAISLLDAGVPPTVSDSDGNTLVHLAAGQNLLELLTYLITHGVDCKGQNKDGDTPLHCAAECSCQVACALLLEADAEASVCNNAGKTPLDLAQNRSIENLLVDHMNTAAAKSGGAPAAGSAAAADDSATPDIYRAPASGMDLLQQYDLTDTSHV
eukprot:m.184787 g.184787  ORF g.184787 m.184787 type:complete len:724 (+) comp16228_c0_seq1:65-2236(+)